MTKDIFQKLAPFNMLGILEYLMASHLLNTMLMRRLVAVKCGTG